MSASRESSQCFKPGYETCDEADWAARSLFWQSNVHTSKRPSDRNTQCVVLVGHGMRLRVVGGSLELRNGLTHFPQQEGIIRFFPGDRDLPKRIIVLDGSGTITFDLIAWLAAHGIPLIQIDYRGRVISVIGQSTFGSDSCLLRKQLEASATAATSMAISTWLIRRKLIGCEYTLRWTVDLSKDRDNAIARLANAIEQLAKPWAGSKLSLLGLEGKCAEEYFRAMRGVPLSWSGTARKPIPDRWRTIGARGSRKGRSNRGATHPLHAMLNYGYAVAESQLRIQIAQVGLDMTAGFLHQQQPYRPALTMDLIEPLRPAVDEAVIRFVRENTFSAADFTLSSEGICRLHPQLARRLVSDIGDVRGVEAVILGLLTCLDHKHSVSLPHRSSAWLAQRGLWR